MTSKISRVEYLLRAKRSNYQIRERLLGSLLRRELDERCYVSFSAGKDSSVVAHAAHAVRPGIPMLMVDPGCPIHWTKEERSKWLSYAQMQNWNLKLFPWDKYANAPLKGDFTSYRMAVHGTMFADLTAYAEANGLTRRVMGLRREESRRRSKIALVTTNTISPIAEWSQQDVWCYIVKHGLPWLTIYDHIGPSARNGIIGRTGEEHGRFVFLRKYYPEAFQEARRIGILNAEFFDAKRSGD